MALVAADKDGAHNNTTKAGGFCAGVGLGLPLGVHWHSLPTACLADSRNAFGAPFYWGPCGQKAFGPPTQAPSTAAPFRTPYNRHWALWTRRKMQWW
jgi:hypothetical protein